MTLGGIVFVILALVLVVAAPAIIGWLPIGDTWQSLGLWLRWPLLALMVSAALALVYRFGPHRRSPKWRWVSWGSTPAVGLWLLAAALFSADVANFGGYNETYGLLGAVVILMMWFYLSAYVVLRGRS